MNCNQHGFVNGKSTLFNILESIDNINKYMGKGDKVAITYLDFSKAFDMTSYSPVSWG